MKVQSKFTFFLPSDSFIYSRRYSHRELVSVTAEPQEKFALVIAAAVEGEFFRLINRSDLELFALRKKYETFLFNFRM